MSFTTRPQSFSFHIWNLFKERHVILTPAQKTQYALMLYAYVRKAFRRNLLLGTYRKIVRT